MNDIIQWCNCNQGFLTAILSIMTILISVIALWVSFYFGQLPYKIRLKAIPVYYHINGSPVIEVMIVNYGNVTAVIKEITILDDLGEIVGVDLFLSPKKIEPAGTQEVIVNLCDSNGVVENNATDLNNKITIIVREYGGKEHKFRKGFPVG